MSAPQKTPAATRVLAAVDLPRAKIGWIYHKDSAVGREMETTLFADWHCPLYNPKWAPYSTWSVQPDEGEMVLQYMSGGDAVLVTKEQEWTDYAVSARIRFLSRLADPTPGNGRVPYARTGVILRLQDVHRYYFFCAEAADRLVLYRREDMVRFEPLGEFRVALDRDRYYRLTIQGRGREITCLLDGQPVIRAQDDALAFGAAGLRTAGMAAFKDIQVTADADGWAAIVSHRQRRDADLRAARDAVPGMALRRTITYPFPIAGAMLCNLRGQGNLDFVGTTFDPATKQSTLVACSDQGDVLWRVPASKWWGPLTAADVNHDGREEIIVMPDEHLRVYQGATGRLLAETRIPPAGPMVDVHAELFGDRVAVWRVYAAQLRPRPAPMDLLLMDGDSGGGYNIWVFDDKLNLRFTVHFEQPPFGHHAFFHDFDGDGREEIVLGNRLLDGDGKILWTMEGAKTMDLYGPGRHADLSSLGWIGDDPADGYFAAMSTGDDGLFIADAKTGKVFARHLLGHVQGHTIAKYRKDVPGLQMICWTRHRGQGILTLIDSRGRVLHRWQPDSCSEGGLSVNWKGDGQELLAMRTNQAGGLWDSFGRLLIPFPRELADPEIGFKLLAPRPLLGGPLDDLAFVVGNEIRIYGRDRDLPLDERIYAPRRDVNRQSVDVSFPAWVNRSSSGAKTNQ